MTLNYPLATEKSIGIIEKGNTITYIVDFRATKEQVKKEFERRFGVRVASIRISNTSRNEKKAFIKLAKGSSASEVAMKLKLV
ncbi:MAG: 50S ribosomal protein L23 [Candidatus Micrarchaeota archaeon]|nr:50S ribosomal protein L23 [Candidatus Micrarchaeota archaeon]